MEAVGEAMSVKLNKAVGPATVAVPTKGLSPGNRKGKALYNPEADRALFEALKKNLKPSIRIVEIEAHINDDIFAEKAVDLLTQMMN